jgi:hypothetical protein
MPHFAMEPVTAFMRTIGGCGRKPVRVGQVTPPVVRIECVAAMYAGLGLDHIGQGTRHGPKSVLVLDRTIYVSQNKWLAFDVTSFAPTNEPSTLWFTPRALLTRVNRWFG